jgi:dTDP-4-dehydrorhamnose 3,5-epimerase
VDTHQLNCGAIVYPAKTINHPKGNVLHGLKRSDPGFVEFGEVYFSTVLKGEIKGWKKHLRMWMNLLVPVGSIRFHLGMDDGFGNEQVVLGVHEYGRLLVPPGVWLAFEGLGESTNLLINLASIEHDSMESVSRNFLR